MSVSAPVASRASIIQAAEGFVRDMSRLGWFDISMISTRQVVVPAECWCCQMSGMGKENLCFRKVAIRLTLGWLSMPMHSSFFHLGKTATAQNGAEYKDDEIAKLRDLLSLC